MCVNFWLIHLYDSFERWYKLVGDEREPKNKNQKPWIRILEANQIKKQKSNH